MTARIEIVDRNPKLNDCIVIECRRRYRNGETDCAALAREYGVSKPSMWYAVRGFTYKHLNDEHPPVEHEEFVEARFNATFEEVV